MIIENVKLVKKTDKFVYFTVEYRYRFCLFFSRKRVDECWIAAKVTRGITNNIYKYNSENAHFTWWASPTQWRQVEVWVHMNDCEELKPHMNT